MKERLIGAAVLVAAAVILIPEMLSGPQREQRNPPAGRSGEPPLKTYTIDLSQSPAVQASTAPPAKVAPENVVQESAPPAAAVTMLPDQPAQSGAASADEATPESVPSTVATLPIDSASNDAAAAPVIEQSGSSPVSAAAIPSQAPAAPPPTPPVAQVAAPVPEPRSGKGWAVQLGSFASQATADSMIRSLRTKGHDAFVMPVKSGNATLYRVRIGPVQDRDSALEILRKVKEAAPGAAVVTHP